MGHRGFEIGVEQKNFLLDCYERQRLFAILLWCCRSRIMQQPRPM